MVRALSRLADHQEPLAPHPATRPHRVRTGRGGGGASKRRYKLRRMLGLVTRIKAVRRRTQTLFELNLELAKLEAKKKATAAGTPEASQPGVRFSRCTASASFSLRLRRG